MQISTILYPGKTDNEEKRLKIACREYNNEARHNFVCYETLHIRCISTTEGLRMVVVILGITDPLVKSKLRSIKYGHFLSFWFKARLSARLLMY